MEERKTYNTTIQLMRGLAVIMVVLQHSISRIAEIDIEFKIMYFLNHIDVAVFFVIAGYLFEIKKEKYYQESKMSYIKWKAKTLLLPYLFWSLILAVGIKVASMVMTKYLMHNPYVSILVPYHIKKMIPDIVVIVLITTISGIIIPYCIARIMFHYNNVAIVLFGRKGKRK